MEKKKIQTMRISGHFATALTIMALLLVVSHGLAQNDYHPIADGCTWSVSNEKYMTAGDTVLDGKTYLKIYRQVGDQPFEFNLEDAEYFAAIRNDEAEKKVYVYLPAWTQVWDHSQGHHVIEAGMEVLLYDFSLQLGDVVSYYSICPGSNSAKEIYAMRSESAFVIEGYENGQALYTVYEDTDSLIVMSDGTTRKRILLETDGEIYEEVWIEGIGRLRGFDDLSLIEAESPFKILLCYSDSMGTFYQTGYDFDDLDDCFNYGHGGGDVVETEGFIIKIYPNPFTEQLHILTPQLEDMDMSVLIYNIMGVCVYKEKIAGTHFDNTINLDFLPKGIYAINMKTTKRFNTQKIIKL